MMGVVRVAGKEVHDFLIEPLLGLFSRRFSPLSQQGLRRHLNVTALSQPAPQSLRLRPNEPVALAETGLLHSGEDRKSTRLNSSHVEISYAVFCLKKKK